MRSPRPRTAALALALTAALACASLPALAQPHPAAPPASAAAPPAPPAPAPDSPRASVKRFLDLCRSGEYAEAADSLDLPDALRPQGPALARRLKTVLDQEIWINLDSISPASLGSTSDKLAPGVEEIGTVRGRTGPEPVRLVRRPTPEGARWIFSRATVERIDEWYARLDRRWIQDHLPESLLRTGPKDLTWWQWIALPLLFAASIAAGRALGYLTRRLLARLAARAHARWDDTLLARLGAPLTLAWAIAGLSLAYPWLGLYPPAEAFLERALRAGFFVALLWFGVRGIEIAGARFVQSSATAGNPAARSLLPLGARVAKIAAFTIAAIAVLSELGYPVTSLIAGLGIGGIVLALAAQKTVENLFGSLSIGVDQPFRVGDFITVDTISGTVEAVGLRSTRIRTLDRTVVTMPNGKLADMRIESFASRDRIRFTCTLRLARASTGAEARKVLEGARKLLGGREDVWPDFTVALAKIGETALEVEIAAWFKTAEHGKFLRLREEVLLALVEIVERAGTTLA